MELGLVRYGTIVHSIHVMGEGVGVWADDSGR